MKTDLFDYHLPGEFIAQHPCEQRDQSRLLVLHRKTGKIEHRRFSDLAEYVRAGDVLVVNDTRVIRARLHGRRDGGGHVEVLLVRPARHASRAGASAVDATETTGFADVVAANRLRIADCGLRNEPQIDADSANDKRKKHLRPSASIRGQNEKSQISNKGGHVWEAMLRCRGRLHDGETITFSDELSARLLGRDAAGTSLVELHCPSTVRLHSPQAGSENGTGTACLPAVAGCATTRIEPCTADLAAVLARIGCAPLPPYIKRPKNEDPDAAALDAERYQTVYARVPGAVAAPTAGLHFTPELMAKLESQGCSIAAVTLHVGPGTFKPIKAENIEDHAVDAEYYVMSEAAADAVNRAGRVIAVGTTSCRVLETLAGQGAGHVSAGQGAGHVSAAQGTGHASERLMPAEQGTRHAGERLMTAGEGWTDLFVRPPYQFKAVDCLVTNFHLPKSSLLLLVSAFATRELILAAYEEAKHLGYRFYSYGDAMLIL